MDTATAAGHVQALGNPTRLRIFEILVRAGENGLTVGRVQSTLKINASTLSHHLKTLISAGLVSQTRDATKLICRANDEVMHGLLHHLTRKHAA